MGLNDRVEGDAVDPFLLISMVAFACFACFYSGHVTRSIPGGPFVSFFGDILPAFAAIASIGIELLTLRRLPTGPKMFAIALILIATISLANVCIDVYSFCNRPHARGNLFGY